MTHTGKGSETSASRGEQVCAALAAAAGLFLTVRIWSLVAAAQDTWLFPGLYFVELAAFCLACAITYSLSSPFRAVTAWATVGILAAFSILAAWTVGLLYTPLAALFLTLAVISDVRHNGNVLMHVGVGLVAAMAQAVATLLLMRWR